MTIKKDLISLVSRKHEIEELNQKLHGLCREQQQELEGIAARLFKEKGENYAEYVRSLVITVDNRKYHPELDEEDGSITLDEVTLRTVEINK